MCRFYPLLLLLICTQSLEAKNYNASFFGIKSDGTTLNTTSIQKAIDYIHEEGGGVLEFYVGRYLTGTIELKSNVTLELHEGAVILGSTNIYDYNIESNYTSLVFAMNANNISIRGKGVVDGQGREVANQLIDQIHKGIIDDPLKYDRPARRRPSDIYFRACKNVEVRGVLLKNAAFWVQVYDQCDGLTIDSVRVDSKAFWNNDGMDIVDCKNVKITNCYIDSSDDGICFKSHDAAQVGENVVVRNCTIRSSANGIKFGTASRGVFRNFRIINNTVYNTYRSAITLASPDGGHIEDVLIDSLFAYNVGNPIYLRIGDRWTSDGHIGTLEDVTIQNVYAEVAAEKPDKNYEYEGPIEDLPRNISPSGIVGLPGHPIRNITLKNIEIIYPGGGDPFLAKVELTPKDLESIPEMPKKYPEFSQFKELPAWGFYIRHAQDITFENITLTAKKKDYRVAIVLDDVHDAYFKNITFTESGDSNGPDDQIFQYKSDRILIE